MAQFKLQAGASLDLLTKDELATSLKEQFDLEWTERARGIKVIRLQGMTTTISGTVAFPIQGPEQGYSWALRSIGLSPSTSAAIRVWVAPDNSTTPPATGLIEFMAANTFMTSTWSSVQAVINGGEYIALSAGASCTTDYIIYAVEVPTQLLWKLV